MPHHHRSPDEYVRPASRLDIDLYCPPHREIFVAGTWHHQEAFRGVESGQSVRLELVPEPRNRWDPCAVALDLDGRRIGYLKTESASMWHDAVRAWNRNGYALYLPGEINSWDDDGNVRYGVTLTGIAWPDVAGLARAAGLHDDFLTLCSRLTPEQKDGLREDRGYTPAKATRRALRDLRGEFDQFTWPGTIDERTGTKRVPFWIGYFVRAQMRDDRERARLIARVLRLSKQRAKAIARHEREQERTAYLQRGPRAVELHRQGMSKRAIAQGLGITERQVQKLVADEQSQDPAASTWHAGVQQARIAEAHRALELQRTGLTRDQIAAEMGRSAVSVKELLSDGKFYEDPHRYPGRHQLARRAAELRGQGLAKAEVLDRLNVSGLAGSRAFRDSTVLETLAAG